MFTAFNSYLLPLSNKDLKSLLADELFSDVTLILDNGDRIKAHKAILASRWDFFKSMLTSEMKEGGKNEIEIKDWDSEVFKVIISYIYTDQIEFNDLKMILKILMEANKYGLIRLKKMWEWELTKVIDHDNVIDLLHLSDTHQASDLRNVCLEFVVQHYDSIIKRKDNNIFNKLSKNTIVELLLMK